MTTASQTAAQTTSQTASQTLAKFVADLSLDGVPAEVKERAKDCIIDTVAVGSFGARFPWSRMMVAHARQYGAGGPGDKCSVFGYPGLKLSAPLAALANGSLVHANEQDSLRQPGSGVHAGACIVPAVLAACEETGADGKTALAAFIAGTEVLFRVGAASHHSSEKLGFHAPGLTGPYGAAVAAGKVYGLNAEQLVNALGIAGSLGGGVLAFTKAQQGAMVKRLHMGRACEAGILAARLAKLGYTGPETILEGKFGFLDVYCRDGEAALLTSKLNTDWETMRICMKRYACHVTSHPPVQALRELMTKNAFKGADVESISIEASDKVVSHHVIPEPSDIMQGQYSMPFNVALAVYRDPDDAASFDDSAMADSAIRAMCRSIKVTLDENAKTNWSSRLAVKLKDGRQFTAEGESFKGMPKDPLNRQQLGHKFSLLMAGQADAARIFSHLEKLETQSRFLP